MQLLVMALLFQKLIHASLQGLIPRVTSLAQLGGSFFLAFLPAVFFISLVFSAIYFVSLTFNSVAFATACKS